MWFDLVSRIKLLAKLSRTRNRSNVSDEEKIEISKNVQRKKHMTVRSSVVCFEDQLDENKQSFFNQINLIRKTFKKFGSCFKLFLNSSQIQLIIAYFKHN